MIFPNALAMHRKPSYIGPNQMSFHDPETGFLAIGGDMVGGGAVLYEGGAAPDGDTSHGGEVLYVGGAA